MNCIVGRKIKKGVTFTQIPNCPIQDRRLTWADLGLLTFLWSLDTSWKFSVQGIVDCRGGGIKATSKIVKRLENTGYLKRVQTRNGQQFGASYFSLTEEPEGAEVPEWFRKFLKRADSLKEDILNEAILNQDIPIEVAPDTGSPPLAKPEKEDKITKNQFTNNKNKKIYKMPIRCSKSDIPESDTNDIKAMMRKERFINEQ